MTTFKTSGTVQGLEGYFRDPVFDRENGKYRDGKRDSPKFAHFFARLSRVGNSGNGTF